MKSFKNISFKGTFRPYQQSVLDKSQEFLSDGRINIVAAPGSGKTILGLELIRRQNSPCIIFSPTTTIKQQWGQRFKDSFLSAGENIEEYFSYDLNHITLLNSVTYQALHSCISKESITTLEEETDYSEIDIFKLIKDSGVKTICLDESHHLQNEWQKSLETFLTMLDSNIVIISLTATPPYDASVSEWERYVSVCGEIDDEIFVPELVKDKTLCPHQDYIFLNYPTKQEREAIKEKKEAVQETILQIKQISFVKDIPDRIKSIKRNNESYFYQNFYSFQNLLSFILQNEENRISLHKLITKNRTDKSINSVKYEEAVQFILDDSYICSDEEKEIIINLLKKNHCFLRNSVSFTLSDKLQKKLVSSSGKLQSISTIAKKEYESLNENLRMLILADFIKKESVNLIGTDLQIDNISIVSIFNEIIKETEIKCGVISGSLVILPTSLEKEIQKKGYSFNTEKINNTEYSIYSISGGNKEKVNLASYIFEEGFIKILIGTQALLGEGWDSPCINSLILASYVGSFMLSNQMRGRAIRSYKKDSEKTANIWHLLTIDNEYKPFFTEYYDFELLKRRFDCFVGPNYTSDDITNGIERITILKPPYTKENIEKINQQMLDYSSDRKKLRDKWNNSLSKSSKIKIATQISRKFHPHKFSYKYYKGYMAYFALEYFANKVPSYRKILQQSNSSIKTIIIAISLFLIFRMLILTYSNLNPIYAIKKFSKVVLKTFKDLGMINPRATLKISTDKYYAHTALSSASIHEQNLFSKAMSELFSSIKNPKFVIVKQGFFYGTYDYLQSFACPEEFSKNKETREIFQKNLSKEVGKFDLIYCHYEKGWKIRNDCIRKSNVQRNDKFIKKIQMI